MNLLITPAEVLSRAFPATEQFREESIRASQIEAAQQQHLRPVLGPLYTYLGEERYATFVETHLKTPLAYYVRSRMIGELSASVGVLGVLQPQNSCGQGASVRQQERLRREARATADRMLDEAILWIEAHPQAFPEYDPQQNIRHTLTLKGGLVL